jgi:hypothetical protein
MNGFIDAIGDTPACSMCGTKNDVTFEPDPYSLEICNDDTKVWLCERCRHERYMDI